LSKMWHEIFRSSKNNTPYWKSPPI